MRISFRENVSKATFPLCLLAVLLVSLTAYDDFFQKTYCVVINPLQRNTDDFEWFLSCSNVRQTIDMSKSTNIRDNASDNNGWNFYSIDDPSRSGVLSIIVIKDRDKLIFYPRLQGNDASITIESPENNTLNRLFSLKSNSDTWTPISRQYYVNIYCVDHGWLKKFFPVQLNIVLKERSSQIWHRNGQIFF